jgi:hypothetical protein
VTDGETDPGRAVPAGEGRSGLVLDDDP